MSHTTAALAPMPEPALTLTLFSDLDSAEGLEQEVEWGEFCALVRAPEASGAGGATPAWAPIGPDGSTGLVLEYDASSAGEEALRQLWSGWAFAAWSEPSSRRWRLLLPLSRAVDAAELDALRRWALGRGGRVIGEGEGGRWAIPVSGAGYEYILNAGADWLDPDQVGVSLPRRGAGAGSALDSAAPSLRSCFSPGILARGLRRRAISLAALPGWPGGPISGHGWGAALDKAVGEGLRPGLTLGIAAADGEVSEALTLQLADGLALRSAIAARIAPSDPLSPVMFITDSAPERLSQVGLARWTGVDLRVLRCGGSAAHGLGLDEEALDAALCAGEAAIDGPLGHSWTYARVLDPALRGDQRLEALQRNLDAWAAQLSPGGEREIWPVVVVSPADTLAPGELDALLSVARARGWSLVLSGRADQLPRQRLDALVTLAITARLSDGRAAALAAEVWGRVGGRREARPRFHWLPNQGRVIPAPPLGAGQEDEAPAPLDEAPTVQMRPSGKRPRARPRRPPQAKSDPAMLRSPRARLRASLRALAGEDPTVLQQLTADDSLATSHPGERRLKMLRK
jgi:hypothetical protein